MYDSPGVLVPWFGEGDEAADRAMMVGVTSVSCLPPFSSVSRWLSGSDEALLFGGGGSGGIHDSLINDEVLADYLLYRLNLRAAESDSLPMGHMERGPFSLFSFS